jgi:hypothetical protein
LAGEWTSTRSAIKNPGVGGKRTKFDSRDVALTGILAALYATINFLQMYSGVGNPMSIYGPVQLRIADCLIALSALLGWPVVGGVTIGCLATNSIYFLSFVDVILGPIANLAASATIFLLRKHRFIGCVAGALPVGLIVGGYLWMFFPPPESLSMLPAWVAMIVSITISSLIAIAGLGYSLLLIFSRPNIIKPLRSRGLKVLTDDA